MTKWKKLSHTIYQCKYHIVWCPKYRYKILKGKIAIKLFKSFPTLRKKPCWGNHFWSRGYCVSSIGLDENKIRKYVKYQEEREKKEESEQQEFGLF